MNASIIIHENKYLIQNNYTLWTLILSSNSAIKEGGTEPLSIVDPNDTIVRFGYLIIYFFMKKDFESICAYQLKLLISKASIEK